MDVEQMDGEQRQAFLALEREINRICDLNEKRLAEFYRMRARRLGNAAEPGATTNARPAGAATDA